MLTKKDFKELAEILKDAKDYDYKHLRLIQEIAKWCKSKNPRFNSDKFFKAVGYDVVRIWSNEVVSFSKE